MYCNGDCTERKQRECSVTFRRDCGPSPAVSTNRGHQHIAALHNALNNNVFSVVGTTAAQPRSSDSSMSPVKIPCPTSPVSSALSSSNLNKLPVKCDRYKTELCRTYEENGTCRYGDKCQFAHGAAELRTVARHPKYKTDLCRTFHTTGFCPYGSRCHFIHSLHERQLPVHPSRLQMQNANLLLPQPAVKSSSAQTNSRMITERQSVDSLLQTLSSLLQTNQLGPNDVATGLLAQQCAMKLAADQAAAEFLARNVLPQGLSHISDAISTSLSTVSVSPCPSPSSLNSVHDDLFTRGSCIPINAHIPQNTSFQSAFTAPSGMLTPPSSPGSAASSLNSVASDYDGYDSSRSVWPALLSPAKDVDISLIPDFAHSRLLTSRHSVFA